ncbi:MAG: glycosyl transferase [Isosphaera sp.]|nr:glycosyl transferase [Isosphaera sp.]
MTVANAPEARAVDKPAERPEPRPDDLAALVDRLAADPTRRVEVLEKLLGVPACRNLGIYPIPPGFKLSVVIPVYNEERWLAELVRRVQVVPIPKELILVNDFSTDSTPAILKQIEHQYDNVRVFHQPKNMGKGAALREGFKHCTGDLVIVQDADWEYDPAEFPKLIQPILEGRADVVVGSRFIGESHRVLYYWHSVANKALTMLSNWFTNLNLTDMETCYKVFRREVIQGMTLKSNRFGFEPEVTAKMARKKPDGSRWRIYEVPISYSGRTYEEGKKIGLKDAFQALYCIVRYWIKD